VLINSRASELSQRLRLLHEMAERARAVKAGGVARSSLGTSAGGEEI
jgi:hypothetical protein